MDVQSFPSPLLHQLHVRQLEGLFIKGLFGAIEAEHQVRRLARGRDTVVLLALGGLVAKLGVLRSVFVLVQSLAIIAALVP